MSNIIKRMASRSLSPSLPIQEEIERFGADGEEAVCRILYDSFDSVIRNVAVPHKELFLEKDFMVLCNGVPFVIEVKHWKGEIGCEGSSFYQNKENGVHKTLKSPVGTTLQFMKHFREFYKYDGPLFGVVIFSEPDCTLKLPEEMDGVALLPMKQAVSSIRAKAKSNPGGFEPLDEELILRCTRFYSMDREYCKGILADSTLSLYAANGSRVLLDTLFVRYISVENQPLLLRDKLYVTYKNGASDVFYNHDTVLTVGNLDGSYRKIAMNKIRHIVF